MATIRSGFGTAAPTTGTWAVGDTVYNTSPAIGESLYWVCVTAGTPGTWIDVGIISPVQKIILENIAALRLLPTSLTHQVEIEGYYIDNDGGGGTFHRRTGAAPGTYIDNGGTIIVPTGGDGSTAWLRNEEDVIKIKWFGAVGDNVADDTVAIQSAIDFAIANRIPEVELNDGYYKTTDTLHLGRVTTGFSTIRLVGSKRSSFAGSLPGPNLLPQATDRPAINIQGGRLSGVSGVTIWGKNKDFIINSGLSSGPVSSNESDYLDPALVPVGNNPGGLQQHSPYAAITIDAFAGTAPLDAYSSAYNGSFSTETTIEEVTIEGFGVGIMSNPSLADGNGDFLRVRDCSISYCVYCVAVGNSQSRNVELRNIVYNGVYTFMTGTRFGLCQGQFNGPLDNIAGVHGYQVFDFAYMGFAGGLTFNNLYVESHARLGRAIGTAAFEGKLKFSGGLWDLQERGIHGIIPYCLIELGNSNVSVILDSVAIAANYRIGVLFKSGDGSFVSMRGCSIRSGIGMGGSGGTAAKQLAVNRTGGMFVGGARYNTQFLNRVIREGVIGTNYATPTGGIGSAFIDESTVLSQLIQATIGYMSVLPSQVQDAVSFTYLAALQTHLDPNYHLALGDLIYVYNTSTLFIVDSIGATDGSGNYPISMTQQNNITIDSDGAFVANLNPDLSLSGYWIICKN